MSIKRFQSRADLGLLLQNRGLIFNSNELQDALIRYNYFNLFNGLETLFLSSRNPKIFKNVSLQDFINLYEFDKMLRSELLRALNNIESKIKSSVAYHFSRIYCFTINKTMEYTNKDNYMNPKEKRKGHPNYCKFSKSYTFKNRQYMKIYNTFDDFIFFDSKYLTNLVEKNDHIEADFYTDPLYTPSPKVCTYLGRSAKTPMSVAVPLWVAIETLSFGSLLMLLHYLKDNVMTRVLGDFNLPISKRFDFLNMLDILLELRNKCAHGFLINRFKTSNNIKIKSNLKKSFSLNPEYSISKKEHSIIGLFDAIKILSYFEDLRNIKKMFWKMVYTNNKLMGYKKAQRFNQNLFNRIGATDYKELKELLAGKVRYII